jgi:hypothetical protein
VENLRILGGGLTPTLAWELPNLTGFDVDRIRVWIFNDVTDDRFFQTTLAVTATQFQVPGGVLQGTGQYVFAVLLDDLRGGGIVENNSRAFTAPYTPAQDIEASAIDLGSDRVAVRGLTDSDDDFYSFGLTAGQVASLVLTKLDNLGEVGLGLFNSAGALLQTGVGGATNVDQVIRNFVAPATGTYFARVSGVVAGLEYSLVVTRNADFDLEPNSLALDAQDLSLTGRVLGSVGAADTADQYLVQANPGDVLTFRTTTPGGGFGLDRLHPILTV